MFSGSKNLEIYYFLFVSVDMVYDDLYISCITSNVYTNDAHHKKIPL